MSKSPTLRILMKNPKTYMPVTGVKTNGIKNIGPKMTGVLNKTGLPILKKAGMIDVSLTVPPCPDPDNYTNTNGIIKAVFALFTAMTNTRALDARTPLVRRLVRKSRKPALTPVHATVVTVGLMTDGLRTLIN